MTKQSQRPTAKIYQFPASPRSTSDSQRRSSRPLPKQQTAGFPTVACGNAWYHDAAMEQSDADCEYGYHHQQH